MGKKSKKLRVQYAALPYRFSDAGPLVALVTSRETRRWILPKGQPEKSLKGYQVAAQEALEEAGLRGQTAKKPFATIKSRKRLKSGKEVDCDVKIYPMLVDQEDAIWPEMHQRERRWLPPLVAASQVSETELARVILEFAKTLP